MSRIQNEIVKLSSYNPYLNLDKAELDKIIASFATLVWLIRDKKITKTTFFTEILETNVLKSSIKEVCGFNSDLELYREILSRNPGICDSKLIRNKLKSAKKSNKIDTCLKSKKKYTTHT